MKRSSRRFPRAIGADGVQTNQPDRIVAAAGQPAPSRLVTRAARHTLEVCLVNARNRRGFPTKRIELRKGRRSIELTAGAGGCADAPGWRWLGAVARFAGDDAVRPSWGLVLPFG
jgi:hypothetical protein